MALEQRIESLRKRHADIDRSVHEEELRPFPDIAHLHELKRIKLHIKDDIARLINGHEEAA